MYISIKYERYERLNKLKIKDNRAYYCSLDLAKMERKGKQDEMEQKTGSCKCKGSRCQVCLNVSETETFTITVTHTSYIK